MAAISPAQAEEVWGPEQPAELVVVPRGGGVFVEAGWWESCQLLMVSGRRWVPLRAERPPRWVGAVQAGAGARAGRRVPGGGGGKGEAG